MDQSINDLSQLDPYESKSRKSSGFSSNASDVITMANGNGGKSRQYSGYNDMDNKSRNCSGNSISAGLVSSGIFNSAQAAASVANHNGGCSTAPVMIPRSTNISPKGGSPLMQSTLTNGIINEQSNNTGDNVSYYYYFFSVDLFGFRYCTYT